MSLVAHSDSRIHIRRHRRMTVMAFTLVELLVATTVSLLLILALAQGFATVSATLTQNRASLEMASRLQGVSHRLQRDLEGATAGGRLWISTAEAQGYLEIFDGPSCDMDVDADGNYDRTQTDADHSFGDIDDVLMLTVRSAEDDLFLGHISGTAQRSDVAEVVWWTRFNDYDGDGARGAEERFNIYRRNLLIRPDLNAVPSTLVRGGFYFQRFPATGTYSASSQSDLANLATQLQNFLRFNDLSVHFEADDSNSGQIVVFAVANTLSDLTLRHNRYCHDPIVYRTTAGGPLNYLFRHNPLIAPRTDLTFLFPHRLNIDSTFAPVNVHSRFAYPASQTYYSELSLFNLIRTGDHEGDDIVLSNVLAFDVRVFDPTALAVIHPGPDGAYGVANVDDDSDSNQDKMGPPSNLPDFDEAGWPLSDDDITQPGDFGYRSNLFPLLPLGSFLPQSMRPGVYVDLAFIGKQNWSFPTGANQFVYPTPTFGGAPTLRSQLVGRANSSKTGSPVDSGTYDTWCYDYENDGINQDYDSDGSGTLNVDERLNGIDDAERLQNSTSTAANLVVDDESEFETAPPYPAPLQSIQVRVRLIDPDTRQVRQTSVVSDYSQ